MHAAEQTRCDGLYRRHLRALTLQGMSDSTIDVYARAIRRVAQYYDCCPDRRTTEQLEVSFAALVASHSWSTVKVDRHGLQCFWKHVLKRDGQWVKMITAPQVRSLPDMLTLTEVEQLIGATRTLRYRVFLLATDSMGLRLGETLALQVGDIDGQRQHVHIRRGKGQKDRLVPLPDLTYQALRALWRQHRHSRVLFPNAVGAPERMRRNTEPGPKLLARVERTQGQDNARRLLAQTLGRAVSDMLPRQTAFAMERCLTSEGSSVGESNALIGHPLWLLKRRRWSHTFRNAHGGKNENNPLAGAVCLLTRRGLIRVRQITS